ncbi:HugZ family protein [Thiohalocapsa sp. ML1]|jgi:heme iron utilization protein|uniref:HugZ family pyridoxamine 5'-phosphate oxidase n=1 Tax=Thiohalocapsa sp. ML1 TaxID=1431688 RepID=UPI0007324104|nr:pyridoxamine 5'-phosphate oxidase family protein [Thiohalocapsa sp. ML1]
MAAAEEPAAAPPDAIAGARALWCGSFHGVLSTQSAAEPGYPFGSVVPLCLSNAGEPLLLLSHLAQHSRNLAVDPRAALTLFDAVDGDIQQGRRLTCVGRCLPSADAEALARWCRHYPSGRVYAEQLNFQLHRFEPLRCHYNGGFAQARWLGTDRLRAGIAHAAATEQALTRLLEDAHADRLAALAGADCAAVVPAGIDRLGITLRCGERLRRIDADAPIADAASLRHCIEGAGRRPFGAEPA